MLTNCHLCVSISLRSSSVFAPVRDATFSPFLYRKNVGATLIPSCTLVSAVLKEVIGCLMYGALRYSQQIKLKSD